MATHERVPAERKRRRPTRSGVVLSAELIVDKALELIDAPGDTVLTMRRLGQALGADPTAVYRYFRDTDALLLAVADRLIGEAVGDFRPSEDPEQWAADLRKFAMLVYHSMLRHPRLAMLRAASFTGGPEEFRAVDTAIGLLMRGGFSAPDAVRHYRTLIDTVLALAAVDATIRDHSPERRAADAEGWAAACAELPAERYPHLHTARAALPAMTESAFPDALDLLLDALARAARA